MQASVSRESLFGRAGVGKGRGARTETNGGRQNDVGGNEDRPARRQHVGSRSNLDVKGEFLAVGRYAPTRRSRGLSSLVVVTSSRRRRSCLRRGAWWCFDRRRDAPSASCGLSNARAICRSVNRSKNCALVASPDNPSVVSTWPLTRTYSANLRLAWASAATNPSATVWRCWGDKSIPNSRIIPKMRTAQLLETMW